MITLKTILRVGGVVVVVIGMMFLPVRNYVFDKGDQNAFTDVAELAAFVPTALWVIVLGSVAFVLSFLVPGDLSE